MHCLTNVSMFPSFSATRVVSLRLFRSTCTDVGTTDLMLAAPHDADLLDIIYPTSASLSLWSALLGHRNSATSRYREPFFSYTSHSFHVVVIRAWHLYIVIVLLTIGSLSTLRTPHHTPSWYELIPYRRRSYHLSVRSYPRQGRLRCKNARTRMDQGPWINR